MRASLPESPSAPPEPAAIEAEAAGGLIVADHGHFDEERATARLLGISRYTVSNYIRANGVPGRRNGAAASSSGRSD